MRRFSVLFLVAGSLLLSVGCSQSSSVLSAQNEAPVREKLDAERSSPWRSCPRPATSELAARLYQQQTSNSRLRVGGVASVLTVPPGLDARPIASAFCERNALVDERR